MTDQKRVNKKKLQYSKLQKALLGKKEKHDRNGLLVYEKTKIQQD